MVIATTGYTGRELYALGDRTEQLYMVGSMGCASSLALGLALAAPRRRVIVIDGDGAALMRLGALATIGQRAAAEPGARRARQRLHESTGGQATVSPSIDLTQIACACGYQTARRIGVARGARADGHLSAPELTFLHVPIAPGTSAVLPRPTVAPPEVSTRLRRHVNGPMY